LGLALVALAGAGCGPVRYLGQVHRADAAVDAARAAHADRYAPYWWTRATQYLHKARELAGHADFQGANRFGQLAADAASLAEQEAVVARKAGTERPARPGDDKRPIAPASDTSPLAPAKDTP
jgi:sRNA-binding protein